MCAATSHNALMQAIMHEATLRENRAMPGSTPHTTNTCFQHIYIHTHATRVGTTKLQGSAKKKAWPHLAHIQVFIHPTRVDTAVLPCLALSTSNYYCIGTLPEGLSSTPVVLPTVPTFTPAQSPQAALNLLAAAGESAATKPVSTPQAANLKATLPSDISILGPYNPGDSRKMSNIYYSCFLLCRRGSIQTSCGIC